MRSMCQKIKSKSDDLVDDSKIKIWEQNKNFVSATTKYTNLFTRKNKTIL